MLARVSTASHPLPALKYKHTGDTIHTDNLHKAAVRPLSVSGLLQLHFEADGCIHEGKDKAATALN
jgi:hypothetical protein